MALKNLKLVGTAKASEKRLLFADFGRHVERGALRAATQLHGAVLMLLVDAATLSNLVLAASEPVPVELL